MKRLLFIICALLFVSAGAFGQVGAYSSTALDSYGKRISSPTVKVCAASDSACSTPVTIYKDSSSTALANPFTGDTQGNYTFWALPGNYTVQVAKSGYSAQTSAATIGSTGTDETLTVLNPQEFAGADTCAQISNAFAYAIAQGWTSATVDARRRSFTGRQNCAASPFAGVSNNGTFTGKLLTAGSQFVITNSALPLIVPGGVVWDMGGIRSLVNPPRSFAGTTVQPATAGYAGAVIELGSTLDPSSPQGARIQNGAIGCLAPGETYVNGTASIAVRNRTSQEMSGGEYLVTFGCQTGFDVESGTGHAWLTSGFDSSGFEHITIHTPNDPAAVGIMFGGALAGLSHVYGFRDVSCTGDIIGVAPGTANGTCADIEGNDVSIDHLRCAYVNTCAAVGLTNIATAVTLSHLSMNSNTNNEWAYMVNLGSHANYAISIENVLANGPGTGTSIVLHDANYPGGACDLNESTLETGFNFYRRGVGGGVNSIVISDIRNGCTSKNNVGALFSTANIWTATQTHQATEALAATGTATSGANFASNALRLTMQGWNGSAGTDMNCALQINPGSGTNPTGIWTFGACGGGSGATDFDFTAGRSIKIPKIATASNCSSSASPAVCSSAIAGSVVIAAAATTVVVNTTAVTGSSQVLITEDSSLGTKLGVTCNTTLGRTYAVTARTSSTSFTITTSAAPVTNPACLSYQVIN